MNVHGDSSTLFHHQRHHHHRDPRRHHRGPHYVRTNWHMYRHLRRFYSPDAAVVQTPSNRIASLAALNASSTAVLEANGNPHAATRFLRSKLGPDQPWVVDPQLTTRHAVVAVHQDTGQVAVAFRGTQPPVPVSVSTMRDSVSDITNDIAIIRGNHDPRVAYASDYTLMDSVVEKYGAVDTLTGYSLGGNRALNLGREYPDVQEIELFNPLIGARDVRLANEASTRTTIHRTTEDPASGPAQAYRLMGGDSVANETIEYREDTSRINPHELEHFYDRSEGLQIDGQQIDGQHHVTQAADTMMQSASDHGTLLTYDLMDRSVQDGMSFTQYLDAHETGLQDPRLASPNDTRAAMWEHAGGTMSTSEERVVGSTRRLGQSDVDLLQDFKLQDASAREMTLQRSEWRVSDAAMSLDSATQEHAAMQPVMEDMMGGGGGGMIGESVGTNAARTGAGLATGLLASYAASKIVDSIPGSENQAPVVRDLETGAIAGGIGAGGSAILTGSAVTGLVLGPEILGGAAAYAAGGATTRAVDRAAQKRGIKQHELLADASGGVVAGVVGTTTTMAAAMAGGVLAGAELSAMIGSVGGPLGMLLGAGIGAAVGGVLGVGSWLVSRLFSRRHR